MSAQKVSIEKNTFYKVIWGLATALTHTLMPTEWHGRENLPAEAPYVMIGNHNHALDPVFMCVAVKKHQVCFMAKKELAKNPVAKWFLIKLHCILVDRHNSDMEAMRNCTRVLREGHILGIFPEGTRYHEGQMEQIEAGTALLTMRAKAPLVPVYLEQKVRFFHKNHCWIGAPIAYDDLLQDGINTETCEKLNERIRETYRKMQQEHPFRKN